MKHFTRQYYVYILTNKAGTVLYTGVTNDLKRRVYEHKNGTGGVFTKMYHTNRLVFYATCEDIEGAILEEKRIKAGSRPSKIKLINNFNKEWHDLYEEI